MVFSCSAAREARKICRRKDTKGRCCGQVQALQPCICLNFWPSCAFGEAMNEQPDGTLNSGETGGDKALAALLELLDLETIDVNIFRGVSPKDRWQRVFGG